MPPPPVVAATKLRVPLQGHPEPNQSDSPHLCRFSDQPYKLLRLAVVAGYLKEFPINKTKMPWPRYVAGPLEGPGCGSHADPDCLCDVVIPARPQPQPYQKMAFFALAEEALASRGRYDPTTLELFQQTIALKEAAVRAGTSPRLHQANLLCSQALAAMPPHGIGALPAMTANREVGRLLKAALEYAPIPVVAGMFGTSDDNLMSRAFRCPEWKVRLHRKMTLEGAMQRDIVIQAKLDERSIKAMWVAMRHHYTRYTSEHYRIIDLAVEGLNTNEITEKMNIPISTTRKVVSGLLGPLGPIRKKVMAERLEGWPEAAILQDVEPRLRPLIKRMLDMTAKRHMSNIRVAA